MPVRGGQRLRQLPRAGLGVVDLGRTTVGQGAAVVGVRPADGIAKCIRSAIGQRLLAHDERAQLGVGEGAVGAAAGLRQADIGRARGQIAGDAHPFHGTVDGRQFVAGHGALGDLVFAPRHMGEGAGLGVIQAEAVGRAEVVAEGEAAPARRHRPLFDDDSLILSILEKTTHQLTGTNSDHGGPGGHIHGCSAS